MPIDIRMPRLTETMTEGAIVAWRKHEGDSVRAGEVIAEIEADKTTVDLEAPADGRLSRIVLPSGADKVQVGDVLAILHRPAEAATATADDTAAETMDPRRPGNGHLPQSANRAAYPAEAESAPSVARPGPVMAGGAAPVKASPLARSMAVQAGLDLTSVRGGGPHGRILKADVLAALRVGRGVVAPLPSRPAASGVPTSPAASLDWEAIGSHAPYDEVPHPRMRQVIAQRLSESKRLIPHFYLAVNCRMDPLLQLRAELQAHAPEGVNLSINDFAIRAAALALRRVPEANASWTDAATRRYGRIDLAVAVATEAGLIAPVIRAADRKGLAELAAEVRDLAARARAGRLRPEEYQGGTFTISNLGMYGIDELYAIINSPQAGILGLGAAGPRPVARAGAVVIETMITCTLSADHRVLDGAAASRFLAAFKALIEQPSTMLL
jgi:pyruvate dehydrogenase E2 component (dihydrolipoamide acetyltransferase)